MLVYLIKCIVTNRHYVGKTTRTLRERWLEHCRDARNNHKVGELYEDLRVLGSESFEVSELGSVRNQRRLNQMERKFIRTYRATEDGYNRTEASRGGAIKVRSTRVWKLSEEQKDKIRASVRASWEYRRSQQAGQSEASL